MKTTSITFLNNKGAYMSIKKEKIPIVRFRDFSEPWIKNQLSEIAEFSKGRGYSKKDLQSHGTPIILYGRLYTNYESVISNVETYANLEENSVVSEGGEVIIPASGESADDISRASCVIDRGIILGGDLNIVRPREYLNSLFIAITLSNGSQQRELSKRAQGKSVVHLHNSDLKAVKLFYPSYEEQSAIGYLFRTLDDLLASYKDNLVNYQSLKATMLSKMFPKAGQTVPEIRLDGFEGEWEEKKLGSLGSVAMNKRIFKDETSDYGDIPFYKIGTFGGTADSFITKEKFKEYKEKYPYPEIGDILISASGSIGRTVVYNGEDAYYQDSNIVWLKHDQQLDNSYLKQYYGIIKWSGIEGTTIKRLYNKNILETNIFLPPSVAEQRAIGTYFSNLDNLINSYQEKISQLETLKKKLLQDMFI